MKKLALTFVLILAMLSTVVPVGALAESGETVTGTYTDIAGAWYSDAASKYGYSDIFLDAGGKFNPGKTITRIEFAQLLHKSLGISINYFAAPDITDSFDDMQNDDVGASALIDMVTTGIIDKGGNFEPDKQLDRDVMIHWLINALNVQTGGNYAIIKIMPNPFNDDAQITAAYKDDVVTAVILKLINGRGNNMLYPKVGATRAEAVTVVSRLVSLLNAYQGEVSVTASANSTAAALTMTLSIQNNTDKAITIHHTSGQKFDFKLFDSSGANLYTWSADKMFIAVLNETVLQAGESVTFSDTLSGDTYSAIKDKIASLNAYIVGTSTDFTIDANGYTASLSR